MSLHCAGTAAPRASQEAEGNRRVPAEAAGLLSAPGTSPLSSGLSSRLGGAPDTRRAGPRPTHCLEALLTPPQTSESHPRDQGQVSLSVLRGTCVFYLPVSQHSSSCLPFKVHTEVSCLVRTPVTAYGTCSIHIHFTNTVVAPSARSYLLVQDTQYHQGLVLMQWPVSRHSRKPPQVGPILKRITY